MIDLELHLRQRGDHCHVTLGLSDAERATDTELVQDAIVSLDIEALRALSLDPIAYGRQLTAELFADPALRDGWGRAIAHAQGANQTLRIRVCLSVSDDALHGICWELLRDPLSDTPLGLNTATVLVRYLGSSDLHPVQIPRRPELRALIAVAEPSDLEAYGFASIPSVAEVQRIQSALGIIPVEVLAPLSGTPRLTMAELLRALQSGPHILYLVCHGRMVQGEPYLWLENEDKTSRRVSANELAVAIAGLETRPLLIVIAACSSAGDAQEDRALAALGPRLARAGVPAVIAMQGLVPLAIIEQLMPVLFAQLVEHGCVDRAMAAARCCVQHDHPWWVPALFSRVRDGVIWRQPESLGTEQVVALLDGILAAVGGRVARRYQATAAREALVAALHKALNAALEEESDLAPEDQARVLALLNQPLVREELALLLDPRPDVHLNAALLFTELAVNGPPPLSEAQLATMLGRLITHFAAAVADDPTLHRILEANLLRQVAAAQVATAKATVRTAVATEQTAQTTDRIAVVVEELAHGVRDVSQALREIQGSISTSPGSQFDAYQAVAAGLGRVGAQVGAGSDGQVLITADDLIEGATGFDPSLLRPLLTALRTSLLHPADGLDKAERAERERRYRSLLITQFAVLRLEGLSVGVRPIRLPLEQVYVQLRAVAEVPDAADDFSPEERRLLRLLDEGGQTRADELREARLHLDAIRRERWTSEQLKRFPIGETLRDPARRGLVILGDPGSGKTTLLQFLALIYARGPAAVATYLGITDAEAERLPIMAPLASYDDLLTEEPKLTVEEFLARYYDRRRAAPGLGPVFAEAIRTGRALILLDGLDEVVDESRRKFVAEQSSAFLRTAMAHGNRVLLTSRIYGYRDAPLSVDLPHITVLDFRREEIALFARQWSRAMAVWDADGVQDSQQELLAQVDERALLAEIRSNPGVERLAVNPLLLTMLALLRRQVGRLPQRRIRLYDLYVTTLVQSWEENRSRGARAAAPARIDLQEAENALIELALWLQQHRGSGTATRTDVIERLTRFYLQDEGYDPDIGTIPGRIRRQATQQAERFLHDMRQFSGLIIERGHNAFGFRHLTLQEYFAGRALARMPAEERWALIQPNLHANRWREPILLAAARLGVSENRGGEATALVRSILFAESPYETILLRDLLLAADCAVDDIDLALPLLRELVSRLSGHIRSLIPSIAVAALRRLHELSVLRVGDRLRLPEADSIVRAALTSAELFTQPQAIHDAAVIILQERTARDHELLIALSAQLTAADPFARLIATQSLAPLVEHDPEIQHQFLSLLADTNSSVIVAAINALRPLVNARELRPHLERLVHRPEPDVSLAAISALRPNIQTLQEAMMLAAPLLGHYTPLIRDAVVEWLRDVLQAEPEQVGLVIAHLRGGSSEARASAARILAPLLAQNAELRSQLISEARIGRMHISRVAQLQVLDAAFEQDVTIEQLWLEIAAGKNAVGRFQAAALLAQRGRATELVTQVLQDELSEQSAFLRAEVLKLIAQHERLRELLMPEIVSELTNERGVLANSGRVGAAMALTRLAERSELASRSVYDGLQHPDPSLRDTFVRSIPPALLRQPPFLDAVINRLDDERPYVRVAAINALKFLQRRNVRVRRAIREMRNDPNISVYGTAYAVLRNIDLRWERTAIPDVQTLSSVDKNRISNSLFSAMGRLPGIRTWALAFLQDPEWQVRSQALSNLGPRIARDKQLREAVVQCLDDPNINTARVAHRVLIVHANHLPDIQMLFVRRLDHANSVARSNAILALSTLLPEQPMLTQRFLAWADDNNSPEQYIALQALAPLLPYRPELIQRARDWITDDIIERRIAAYGALSIVAVDIPDVWNLLRKALIADIPRERQSAVTALCGVLPHEERFGYQVKPGYRAGQERREAVVTLLTQLITNDHEARALLLTGLSTIAAETAAYRTYIDAEHPLARAFVRASAQSPEIVAEVETALGAPSGDLRHGAAYILGALEGGPPPERIAALVSAIDDQRGEDACEAQVAAAEILLNNLTHSQASSAVLGSIAQLDGKPLVPFGRVKEARRLAILALGRLKPDYRPPGLIEQLIAQLEHETEVKLRDSLYSAILALAAAPELV